MAELVDALDLGSSGVIHGGSSPFTRTINVLFEFELFISSFFFVRKENFMKIKNQSKMHNKIIKSIIICNKM